MHPTHQVTNQPVEFNYNLYTSDRALQNSVAVFGGQYAADELERYGGRAMHNLMHSASSANNSKPVLRTHDRFGHRINQVDFHPAYHSLMTDAIEAGMPSLPWAEAKSGAHVARSALVYMHNQAEAGTTCPTTMTFSAVPALRHQPDVTEAWIRGITSRVYDQRNLPWYEKDGLTIGMAMTEKQGGSDVRANQSTAVAVSETGAGKPYLLTGHKWFCSAPMSDGFLVLAQTDNGIGCFLMPRWTPEGELNSFYIQRLKDKLGNWSNASSEIEFSGAFSWLIGEEGRGINTILEMVAMTRYDCMLGSSSLMRQAIAQALHHCSQRKSFGTTLNDHGAMQNVLADLAVESEAELLQTMRLAKALDAENDSNADQEFEQLLLRLATPVGKFWICKRTPDMVAESLECHGGSGYVEESVMPRLFRESPLNSIWEGCGNIQSLDVLRAIAKQPSVADAYLHELEKQKGSDSIFDKFLNELKDDVAANKFTETSARALASRLARALQAAMMIQYASSAGAEFYLASRVATEHGIYGVHDDAANAQKIIDDALPMAG